MTATEPLSRRETRQDHAEGVADGIRDPVGGMAVDPVTAENRAAHAGHTYYFCSSRCRERFEAEPVRYLTPAASQPARPSAREVLWTCPMHPQIVREASGSCPICGMALEPMTPTGGDTGNPELRQMTQRVWGCIALSLAPVAL